jgi:hypothetical protein
MTHPDLDNLLEPMFSALVGGAGWFRGSRPNIRWFVARKLIGPELGAAVISPRTPAPHWATIVQGAVIDAVWNGPLPLSARDPTFASWVAANRSAPVPDGPFAVSFEFGSMAINLGDIATGRVKNLIDGLQPILGGPFGNPDDHRIVALHAVKGNLSLDRGVAIRVGSPTPS